MRKMLLRGLGCVAIWFAATAAVAPGVSFATEPPVFALGFEALATQIADVAGTPIETEHYGANGDSLQQTTKGLMVWRKADNWTAFTNGGRTWVNGPYGVMERGNDERFDWELEIAATPTAATPPVYVDNAPSDYDLSHSETIVQLEEGRSILRIRLANKNHYWTAVDIRVTVSLVDGAGRTIATDPATGGTSRLGPQQNATWERDLPSGRDWRPSSPSISFRWAAPGE